MVSSNWPSRAIFYWMYDETVFDITIIGLYDVFCVNIVYLRRVMCKKQGILFSLDTCISFSHYCNHRKTIVKCKHVCV